MSEQTVNILLDTREDQHRVLSALVLQAENARVYAHAVAPEMFDQEEREVLGVIRAMVDKGIPIDTTVILRGLQMARGPEAAMRIGTMLMAAENAGMIEAYIALLEEAYRRKKFAEMATRTHEALAKGIETDHLGRIVAKQTLTIQGVGKKERTYTPQDILALRAERAAQRAKDEEAGREAPKYGVACMDMMTRGMVRQRVSMLAARPGMGKTVFGLRTALNVAGQGYRTLFVSLEMSLFDLEERITCMMSGVEMKKITHQETQTDKEKERIQKSDEMFQTLPFEMIAKAGLCIEDLELMIRAEAQKGAPYDVVVVDYVQIINSHHFDASKHMERMVHVSERLRVVANDCMCHIFALAQLNRETKRSTKPSMEHIKGSGQFEQDVYAIFLLDNEHTDPQTPQYHNTRRVQLAKNRADGTTGEWTVEVDFSRMFVGNIQLS